MLEEQKIDQYGLTQDDEFYNSFNLTQVSDEGAVEVRPYTNVLMTWLKCRMNQLDTIDISKDGMSSLLNFETYVSGADSDLSIFAEDESVSLSNYIEVDESTGLITYYIYAGSSLDDDLLTKVVNAITKSNQSLWLGHFEIFNVKKLNYKLLRYKASVNLKKIKVGKVDVLEDFITISQVNCSIGLSLMSKSDNEVKEWICD